MCPGALLLAAGAFLAGALDVVNTECFDAAPCFSEFANAVGIENGHIPLIETLEDMETFCTAVSTLGDCVETPSECRTAVDAGLTAQLNVLRYVCSSEAQRLYFAHKHCLNRIDVKSGEADCVTAYKREIDIVHATIKGHYYASADQAYKDTCSAIDRYITCVCEHVQSSCGTEAAAYPHNQAAIFYEVPWSETDCNRLIGEATDCRASAAPACRTHAVFSWQMAWAVFLIHYMNKIGNLRSEWLPSRP